MRGHLYDCTFRLNLLPPVGPGLDSGHYQELEHMYKYTVCAIKSSTQQVNTLHSEKSYMCCWYHMAAGSGPWTNSVLMQQIVLAI